MHVLMVEELKEGSTHIMFDVTLVNKMSITVRVSHSDTLKSATDAKAKVNQLRYRIIQQVTQYTKPTRIDQQEVTQRLR